MCRLRPLTFLLPSKPHRPPERVIGTDWQSMMTALGSASRPAFLPCTSARHTEQTLNYAALFPLTEVVVHRLPRCKPAGQHSPLAACFEQVQQAVQDVPSQIMLAVARGVEDGFDFLPSGVRQVRAIVFAHSFGIAFGRKVIHHRKRGGLPFVFTSETQNQNSFSLHILHDRLPELAAFEQLSALQVALEVVRHALLSDGVLQPVEDGVGRFVPAHVLEHDPAR